MKRRMKILKLGITANMSINLNRSMGDFFGAGRNMAKFSRLVIKK